MSKKEKSKKNVFGLVSKLGNLIKGTSSSNNSDNMDTSAGENEFPKKNFNIHISEDNQEQIDLGDEEEEEEEEEENVQEEIKESKNVNKIKNDNDEKKENIEIKDENKNIDKEIKNNENKINDEILTDEKDKNKKEENEEIKENNIENKEINENNKKEEMNEDIKKEEKRNENEDKIKEENNINNNIEKIEEKNNNIIKEEDKKESKEKNNIINENNNIINIDTNEEKTNEEKKEETTDIAELNIEEEDINETCHIYLKPGNDFNSKEMYCLPISKIKLGKKKSLIQKINVFKKAKAEIINYKIFFEDNFIYFANDIIIDKNDDTMRRINKIYNIRNILNYTSNKNEENKKYKIMIEIMNKKNIKKSKEYLIEEQYFKEFNDELIKKLKLYGDKLIKNEK